MLNALIETAEARSERLAIASSTSQATWGELRVAAAQMSRELQSLSGRRVGIAISGGVEELACLAALDHLKADTFLLNGSATREELLETCQRLALGALVRVSDGKLEIRQSPNELSGSGRSTVTILTSGTTGKPKAATHTWEGLARPVRASAELNGGVWALCFRPHLYAGIQVILQCLKTSGTLAIPSPNAEPGAVASLLRDRGVMFASATPSYWRRLLLFAPHDVLAAIPFRQITLGGEVADQQVLDMLKRTFPSARLVHIYATTELGRCFSVTDGRAGFSARFLERPSSDGVEMRIQDGELWARSANAMIRYDQAGERVAPGDHGWVATGDLVQQTGDRVFFVGRKTDLLNVGGNKVHPLEVEAVIRSVPGVADVRVFARKSSIAGQLVACELVANLGVDRDQLRAAVLRACDQALLPYQRPRFVEWTERVSVSDASKVVRTER